LERRHVAFFDLIGRATESLTTNTGNWIGRLDEREGKRAFWTGTKRSVARTEPAQDSRSGEGAILKTEGARICY
jgi:hypothetical protein